MPLPWAILYLERLDGSVPAQRFLATCPIAVRARILAVLDAVAAAPPPAFSGGGFWEAMHAPMSGYHEVRVQGQPRGGARLNYRLFCYLDRQGPGLAGEAIVLLDGRAKALRSALSEGDYAAVGELGAEYRASSPRRIAIRYSPGQKVPASRVYLCDGTGSTCPHSRRFSSGDGFPTMPEDCGGAQWRPSYRPARD